MFSYEEVKSITEVSDILNRASKETGVKVNYIRSVKPCIDAGTMFMAMHDDVGIPAGFIVTQHVTHPDTGQFICLEKMLFIDKEYRGGYLSRYLLVRAEECAVERNCSVFVAGSSLNHNENTRVIYERAGFKTNYTFEKDLT